VQGCLASAVAVAARFLACTSWQNFNYPPAPFRQNSLFLSSDGVANWLHDIDYNAVTNSTSPYYTLSTRTNGNPSCFDRGSGS
jgi:hypothetical protein